MKVRYFRNKNVPSDKTARAGVVTVVYDTVDGAEDEFGYTINNVPAFGVAFCSPKDQFNKRIGRLIAAGRLSKKNGWKDPGNTNDVLLTLIEDVQTPSWAREVLQSNLLNEISKN
jgi:hypothetical protein